jgi:predicted nuclease with RNAse H fold
MFNQLRSGMTVIEIRPRARFTARARQEADEKAEYRERILVNVVAAAFIAVLMVIALWVVSTLAGVV